MVLMVLIPLLNLLINCISARSAPQILSLKDDCTLRFSIFLIIGLCNSSANSWFDIISLLTRHQKQIYLTKFAQLSSLAIKVKRTSYQKNYKP